METTVTETKENFEEKVVGFDTDFAPSLSDVTLRAAEDVEEFMVVYTSSKDSDDLSLSILPINEYNLNLVRQNNLKIIARGESTISVSSLAYGVQHSTRLLYKSLVQDMKHFYLNRVSNRFEEDDKLLRTELNKLV